MLRLNFLMIKDEKYFNFKLYCFKILQNILCGLILVCDHSPHSSFILVFSSNISALVSGNRLQEFPEHNPHPIVHINPDFL